MTLGRGVREFAVGTARWLSAHPCRDILIVRRRTAPAQNAFRPGRAVLRSADQHPVATASAAFAMTSSHTPVTL
jgi:hypothetical protein